MPAPERPSPAKANSKNMASRPQHKVDLLSFTCEANGRRPLATVTIRNSGSTTISYAKAFVSFSGAIEDSYFSPHDLPPGVIAKANVYSPGGGDGCQIISVQDGDGVQAAIREPPK